MYEYDDKKTFCFNTSNLTPMGIVFWEEDEEYELINWYMKIAKCINSTSSSVTCKPIEEINKYIHNMFLTRTILEPLIDLGYIDTHLNNELPF